MVSLIQAKDITLYELETKFGLQWVEDEQFFREWQEDLLALSQTEQERLDRVKASYLNLLKYPPMLENTVKMVVLSPLLDLAGFYLSPFHIKSEKSIELTLEDEDLILKGQIDILALKEQLWITVIESKRAAFSLEVGLPQLLAYMLANPHSNHPTFGLISNGGSFMFVKLEKQKVFQYSTSKIFEVRNPGNDLYQVLQILKKLGKWLMANG